MYILAGDKGSHTYNSEKKGQLYVFRFRKSGFFAYNTAENGLLYVFWNFGTGQCGNALHINGGDLLELYVIDEDGQG